MDGSPDVCRLELLAQVTPVWAESETELIASRSAEVDLERICKDTHGYVGADLAAELLEAGDVRGARAM